MTHMDLIEKFYLLIEEARKTAGGRKILCNVPTDELEQILNECVRSVSWAAGLTMEISALSNRVSDLQQAVIKHPKFQGKTALVWRHELDELFFQNYSSEYPMNVPKLDEAKRIARYMQALERVSKDAELCKRFEDVIAEFKRVDDAQHHRAELLKK